MADAITTAMYTQATNCIRRQKRTAKGTRSRPSSAISSPAKISALTSVLMAAIPLQRL